MKSRPMVSLSSLQVAFDVFLATAISKRRACALKTFASQSMVYWFQQVILEGFNNTLYHRSRNVQICTSLDEAIRFLLGSGGSLISELEPDGAFSAAFCSMRYSGD